jgi:uncharacterized protein (TIGR00299 family) protein
LEEDKGLKGGLMRVHLDPLGGIAGDMFIAAMLDALANQDSGADHEARMLQAIDAVGPGATIDCRLVRHNDGLLQGRRFVVRDLAEIEPPLHPPHHHHHDHHDHGRADLDPHSHGVSWSAIGARIASSKLSEGVKHHAIGIFTRLAEAEARVHGLDVDDVAFHEVGAWDSIADIVGAAYLIDAVDASAWTVGPAPLGSGRIATAHGPMPAPAPATALLLEGFPVIDDGIPGERVTPTGAAILRHVCAGRPVRHRPEILAGSGIGFGAKTLHGISNCLRVMLFDDIVAGAGDHRQLAVIEFEVDDQSAEDLAVGLDRLRAHEAIFDVVQAPVFGKKGRMMTHVRILARAAALDEVVAASFRETTTIGLRHQLVDGVALPRTAVTVEIGGRPVRVKSVDRPGGRTAKAEADDALSQPTHAQRSSVRREAERRVLAETADA